MLHFDSAFLTPANAMLSVELGNLAEMLDSTGKLRNVSQQARDWSSRIQNAIWNTTVSKATDGLLASMSNTLLSGCGQYIRV